MSTRRLLLASLAIAAVAVTGTITAGPAHAESCGTGMNTDGTPKTPVCKDGKPNRAARSVLVQAAPRIAKLTARSGEGAIVLAACADAKTATTPMVVAALEYDLAAWHAKRPLITRVRALEARLADGTACVA